MTKSIRIAAAGITMFAAFGMTSAASAQDATADATATILEALTFTNEQSLDFGTLVLNNAPATVTIAAADGATAVCPTGGDVICSGTSTVAVFNVEGSAGRTVLITLPTEVDLQRGGTGVNENEVIELNGFTSSEGGEELVLPATDVDFYVGGTINLDGDELAGVYTGSFDVAVAYE